MATSSHPMMASQPPMTQILAHVSLKQAQAASLIVPPAYVVTTLLFRRGKPFSIRGLMRSSTRWTVGSAALGLPVGYGRLRNEPDYALEDRAFRMANNATQIETDDYSIIGATLGALVSPALLLNRAPLLSLVAGGASIGLGCGVDFHLAKMFQDGHKVKPEGMVGEIPIVGGNEK